MSQRFYEEDEAEEILRLAAQKSAVGGMSRERLLATAAELGISPEAVEEAERTVTVHRREVEVRSDYDRHVKGEFYSHLSAYVVVNAFLIGMNFFTDGRIDWAIWPLLGWGIGIASHFSNAFIKRSSDYEESYEKWKARREERLSGRGTASELVHEWLTQHPGDTKGAARYVRQHLDLRGREAKSVVERHRI